MKHRTDHAEQALQNIRAAARADAALVHATIAQAHATLALVEQQRIANLIALGRQQKFGRDGARISIPSYGEDGMLRPDIAAALGIETGADS